ncbi:oxygen-independent coproporphyrinogen III oxidase [Enterobacteriaceae bacterium LUAb1]
MNSMQHIEWDQELIQKYNHAGPRYTSYPTALEFSENYAHRDFLYNARRYSSRPLSLYVHIPFCHRLCYFCGCNKQITRQLHKAERYLAVLAEEIASRASLFADRQVIQMHWGGGTPTFLNKRQITRLMQLLRQHFQFSPEAELSIEVDPREIELNIIDHLYSEGFNRLSMGVQDFDKTVQARVNRVQDEAFIFELVAHARQKGFRSVSIDLIYGLPMQTRESFAFTLERVVALAPDRLSVFNYAHLPALFAAQRKIKEDELPGAWEKLGILQQTIQKLINAGYQFIGMDHFARPNDELAVAQRCGELHRNFQGYTTQGECDLLGLGVSAISMVGDSYAQNEKGLNDYYAAVETRGEALWRGIQLTADDCLRREVIKQLICNFSLDITRIEQEFNILFEEYFADDLKLLSPLAEDGLIVKTGKRLQVTPKGRLLIRNICMCFDKYMRQKVRQQQFSRVI